MNTHLTDAKKQFEGLLEKGEITVDNIHATSTTELDEEWAYEYRRALLYEHNVSIYYRYWIEDSETEEQVRVKAGTMKLHSLPAYCDYVDICDSIDGDLYTAGLAIKDVMDEDGDNFDEDIIYSNRVYVLSRFDLEPEYRGKGLGYIALHKGLQIAGCEWCPVFLSPSENEKDAGQEFLIKFYQGGDSHSYYLKEHNVVVYPSYNGTWQGEQSSVQEMREKK